jgi:hypothetical protein
MVRPLVWAILWLATCALGCGAPPRLDTSSEARATASLEEVRASLPERMRPAFDEAVTTVVVDRLGEDWADEMAGGARTFGARALEPLNGMTAEEVLTEARRIVADREATGGEGQGESRRPPP